MEGLEHNLSLLTNAVPDSFIALGFLNTEVFNLATFNLGAESSLYKLGSTMQISAGLAGGLFGISLG